MAIDVKIPPMGESISSGILSKWHVKDGDVVKKDQPLFELETDKITSEGTAEVAGKITFQVAAGTEVKIGQIVASIDESAAAAAPAAAPSVASAKEGAKRDEQSPAVRRIAAETGIDPASVAGSGKAGRVTKGDMLAAGDKPATTPAPVMPSAAPATVPSVASAKEGRQTRVKMTKLRQTIASRLVSAQHEAAMLT